MEDVRHVAIRKRQLVKHTTIKMSLFVKGIFTIEHFIRLKQTLYSTQI